MQPDRQSIVQSIVESALRAAADPEITQVLRSWDYYQPGTTAQPLMPILVVSVTDDEELGIGFGLYRCSASVSLVMDWAPSIRDHADRIRGSVRATMRALQHVSAYGVTIDATRELTCSEPEVVSPQGDVVLQQTLSFAVWFEAQTTAPAVIDPEIYLVARDPETGVTYTTRQAADPRRITRWVPSATGVVFSHGFGAWDDRAALAYSSPVQPLSTEIPPIVNNPSASAS